MVPGLGDIPIDIKYELEQLTMVEEMLISPVLAIMSVFRLPGGALINRGFCANFLQDVQSICKILPRLPRDLPILILKKKDQNNNIKQFKVNRERVEKVLRYLCKNNPAFINNNITIDEININSLPIDGVPEDLLTLNDNDDFNVDHIIVDNGPTILENESNINDEINTLIESDSQEMLQVDKIKNDISFPSANKNAINEFQMDSIASLVFPKLFPNGEGDPTTKSKKLSLKIILF
jgi:hypothetical protein